MSWNPLDWLSPASDLVDSVGDAIDKNVTSDEERMTLRNELKTIITGYKIKMAEFESEYQKELTKRWESDNQGSWLAKNIRPLSLVYLLAIISILAVTDGNYYFDIGTNVDGSAKVFMIKEIWVDLFTALAVTAFGGYFLSRGYEKGRGVTK